MHVMTSGSSQTHKRTNQDNAELPEAPWVKLSTDLHYPLPSGEHLFAFIRGSRL